MADIAELTLRVNALEVKNADKALKKLSTSSKTAEKRTKKLDKSYSELNRSMSAFTKVAIGAAALMTFKKFISATIEQENAVRQLEQRLRSTSGVVGITSKELQIFASDLQKITTYGDEATLAMQGVLLTFTNIRQDIFKQTTVAVMNLSTAMGVDLKSSAIQLGKVLNAPTANLSALTRSGIQFTDSQKSLIKELEASGRLMEAQKVILAELETQFGGAAEAARGTLGGALQALSNAGGDLFEANEKTGELTSSINSLTKILESPQVKSAFSGFALGAIETAELAASSFTEFYNSVTTKAKWFAAYMNDEISLWEYLSTGRKEAEKTLKAFEDLRRLQLEVALGDNMGAGGGGININTPDGGGGTPTAAQAKMGALSNIQGHAGFMGADLEAEKAAYFDSITSRFEGERNLFMEHYNQMLEQRKEFEQQKTDIISGAGSEQLGIESHSLGATTKLIEQTNGEKAGLIAGGFASMLSSTSKFSKKAFKVQKAASLANAVIDGYAAATAAWKAGMATGGPYAPAVAAAYTAFSIAKTAAQIKAIKSQSYGGGGSNTNVGAGGSINASTGGEQAGGATEAPSETQIVKIDLKGEIFGREQVGELISSINDALEDGYALRV